ncbi:hypothetical protein ACFQY0_02595 [Haloferula chungangensis]|uniref:Uncharacterized protein n=1 Tax=Haloferula chungangensis TaxID=1048331 RepID=A0ABW2L2Z3_9BACT
MNQKKLLSSRFRASRPRGFALIITISMMILLALLAVGLLTLSSISLRSSGQGEDRQIAQANARLALTLALGELQTTLGPDARMSARAETLGKDPRAGGTVSPNTPEAWWVGVSHTDGETAIDSKRDIAWLVSGLKGTAPDSGLTDPVPMIDQGSLDLTLTGNQPIQAGRVSVEREGKTTGAYAWFVDDNGMKAQLAASHQSVHNDNPENASGGVLPASYKPDILEQMSPIGAASDEEIFRLGSNKDLELIDLPRATVRNKFFSYTTCSQGVLSDTRNGGLKKDLTIAFENDSVFSKVFPSNSPDKYLLIDPDKRPKELDDNGYIHWAIFKDYYNLKKSIKKVQGKDSLHINTFDKRTTGFLNGNTAIARGESGPHSLNHRGLIYDKPDYFSDGNEYGNNPIFPLLAHLQQNSWIQYNAADRSIETHVQLWTSHYNPYNIGIRVFTDRKNGRDTGPRVINYPLPLVSVSGLFTRVDTLNRKLQAHAPGDLVIPPGRSQVFGFSTNEEIGQEIDDRLYSEKVKDLTVESVKGTYSLRSSPPTTVSVTTEFYSTQPVFVHGCDHKGGDYEAAQAFYAPLAWDKITSGAGSLSTNVRKATPAASLAGVPRESPGKRIVQSLSLSELNSNSMVSHAFSLRTTREPGSRLRPLVDGNIRAQWNNPRWDSPLNIGTLATYSDNTGVAEDRFVPMNNSNPPLGYSFLGAGRTPADGTDQLILFDVPRRDLVSLGQLQHAAAGRFSYEPSYIVGNSYANPRIPLDQWDTSVSDTFSTADRGLSNSKISGSFSLYDASYLVNETLWDSYTFTTIPQEDDNYGGGDVSSSNLAELLDRSILLPNPRFIPYEPAGSKFDTATLSDAGTADTGSFFHNAGHLLVDGAFNINSTSVDAWEAFLTGTYKLPIAKVDENGRLISGFTPTDGVRFPRCARTYGDGMKTASIDENYWIGFRELTQTEVRDIATALVDEIKERGPFLTLSSFVNRSLESNDTGKSGPLQAALDQTVNKDLDNDYEDPADTTKFPNIADGSTQGAGFPGQLLQGDILQALGPYMTVHSDTFTIRAYGEAQDAAGNVTASAWCEAVVQRHPEPMAVMGAKSANEELANPTSPFGRTFRVISFRWLNPKEV